MRIIVIGASHAGIAFVDAMRRNGFAGGLCLVDRQPGQPLERPPLSKAFLAGDGGDGVLPTKGAPFDQNCRL